ncbi:hypothetical protein SAMN05428989_2174 [Pseudoxanthomonas sp. GM95]|uniref:hypothetical protein n=1 Tax=Pseudoxanthomonas sp. GM95 TaxID=1881043 RepID=UPI0008CAC7D4|nr:hypothetical protein [Pseudoxanthomonas sp. GM95]SEL65879.1 hypothetical protein SAMN05428989_2174 [Pseudoxanthomonas sp. GM95]
MSAALQLLPVYRITVFVPPADVEAVKAAIVAVDDLAIGHYREVMWTSAPGIEQFRPGPQATPTVGSAGALTADPTVRLECSISRDAARLQRVLQAINAAHPWEVPAVFVDESLFPLP